MGRRSVDVTPDELVRFMIQSGKSIRETAIFFNISKSTVHRLVQNYEGELKEKIEGILKKNTEDSWFKNKQ